jgi:Zn-dependent M28 family amino/carboxypeptidase
VAATAAALPASSAPNNNTSQKLRAAVTPDGVMDHLRAFDQIGRDNGGTRASGLPGYAASKDYVVGKLRAAGYAPTVQEFDFPFFRVLAPSEFEQLAPTPTTYVEGTDFATMTYSGSGDVTASVTPVDLNLGGASTSGCEPGDFAGFPAGNVALIRRGTCTFGIKAANAEAAGAGAVVVFNTNPGDPAFAGTLGAPLVQIPVIGTSHAIGQSLAVPGATARVSTLTESEIRQTWNVLAETPGGNPDNVVMAGAHLDSVVAGPGVNDNGSGSAAILEVAEQMAKVAPENKTRFAWWGAEELSLLGSKHYVNDLAANDPAALDRITLYLNFDMVGSPNYSFFVYDGDNSEFPVGPGAAEGPAGSAAIEDTFHDIYAMLGEKSAQTAFSGRSDYGPFIAVGIPAGGLFTGAEERKTQLQADAFGGDVGTPFDPCYHQACDTIENVDEHAIDVNSDAIAHTILTYAMDTRDVNGVGDAHPVTPPGQHVDGTPIDAGGAPGGGGLHDDHDEALVS